MELEEYVGKRFNHVTIIGVSERPRSLDYVCDCGKKGTVYNFYVKKIYSCGCMKRRGDAYIGKRFGRLTVIERATESNKFVCKCDCGKTCIVSSVALGKHTNSCGCLKKEISHENGRKWYVKDPQSANDRLKTMREKTFINGWNVGKSLSTELYKNNKSGVTGVCFDSREQLWRAYISIKGKQHKLGKFANKEDAIAARKRAEEKRLLMIMEDTE